MARLITFTSDFGSKDSYTGVVKGVILSIAPDAKIVDISHDVEPWNVAAAAWIITCAYKYFPEGTIHIVVVDPAVGSDQRRILLYNDRECFIGPDNGIFSLVMAEQAEWNAVELNKKEYWLPYVSHTFHTRDIFGPVAAHIANGVEPHRLGSPIEIESLAKLADHQLECEDGKIKGSVIHVDRFGNLISNIPNDKVKTGGRCYLKGKYVADIRGTYSSVETGKPVAFRASHGFLEIAIHKGRASEILNAAVGTSVRLEGL